MVAADWDHPAVAAMEIESAGGGGAETAGQARLETHPSSSSHAITGREAVDGGSGPVEQFERLLVAPELDPDLVEDPVGMFFQPGQRLVVQKFVGRDDSTGNGSGTKGAGGLRRPPRSPCRPTPSSLSCRSDPAHELMLDRRDTDGPKRKAPG